MEENTLEPDYPSPPSKSKKSLLTNPALMGWITIISLPLSFWGIYLTFAFNKEIKPVYRVLSDVVVTESRLNSKIKVYYDSVEVKNVRAATIALWNAGSEYLDKRAFSVDRPISIRSAAPVMILEVKTIITTRPDLKFIPTYNSTKKVDATKTSASIPYNFLDLQIKGDEGLEANDGATFLVLYTSKVKGNWYVDARIKGVPTGIQKATEPIQSLEFTHIFLCFASFFFTLTAYKDLIKYGRSAFKVISLLVTMTLFFITSYTVVKISYQTATTPSLPEILSK